MFVYSVGGSKISCKYRIPQKVSQCISQECGVLSKVLLNKIHLLGSLLLTNETHQGKIDPIDFIITASDTYVVIKSISRVHIPMDPNVSYFLLIKYPLRMHSLILLQQYKEQGFVKFARTWKRSISITKDELQQLYGNRALLLSMAKVVILEVEESFGGVFTYVCTMSSCSCPAGLTLWVDE